MRSRGRGRRALSAALVAAGLAVLAYYPASEAWDAHLRAQAAAEADYAADEADEADLEELFAQARAYNAYLAGGEDSEIAEEDVWSYDEQLSLGGHDTAFGYVVVPALSLTVPVYHGTSSSALSKGCGHLEGTSLPIGGESTHAVIAGHTGLTGSRAFDQVCLLEEGDVVGVKVLGRLVCYEVTGTEVVEPDEVGSLAIEEGQDLITLVTCWPYGVNTHRLLVHASRCEVPDDFWGESGCPVASALASALASGRVWPLAAAAAAVGGVCAGRAVSRHRRALAAAEYEIW